MSVEVATPETAQSERPSHRTALLVTFSAIPDDPRVRRMGDFLTKRGWRVIGFGLDGARAPAPAWEIHATPAGAQSVASRPDAARSMSRRFSIWIVTAALLPLGLAASCFSAVLGLIIWPLAPRFASQAWIGAKHWFHPRHGGRSVFRMLVRFVTVRRGDSAVERLYWRENKALPAMRDAAVAHGEPGVWVANDWLALPIATAGAQRHGGIVVYDSHEFATEEYAERPEWRIFQRPFVRNIESRFIKFAKVVTSVSPGIAQELKTLYRLKTPVFAFRNMPPYEAISFRPTGEKIKVLYHGIVGPGRGLLEAIDSVPLWRDEFQLTIRGPATPAYIQRLEQRISALNLMGRVIIEQPIPTSELVKAASDHDVGFFALPGHSKHNEYALPNKIFEYMMGGLALVLSDLTEMRRVLDEFQTGIVIQALTAEEIAQAVNSLDRARIDGFKRASLMASQQLHWDVDASRAADAYAEALAAQSAL